MCTNQKKFYVVLIWPTIRSMLDKPANPRNLSVKTMRILHKRMKVKKLTQLFPCCGKRAPSLSPAVFLGRPAAPGLGGSTKACRLPSAQVNAGCVQVSKVSS